LNGGVDATPVQLRLHPTDELALDRDIVAHGTLGQKLSSLLCGIFNGMTAQYRA
jgi:hypothetical protein